MRLKAKHRTEIKSTSACIKLQVCVDHTGSMHCQFCLFVPNYRSELVYTVQLLLDTSIAVFSNTEGSMPRVKLTISSTIISGADSASDVEAYCSLAIDACFEKYTNIIRKTEKNEGDIHCRLRVPSLLVLVYCIHLSTYMPVTGVCTAHHP